MLNSTVTLGDLRNQRTFGPVDVGGDGTFEFRRVPCGAYLLTVLDGGRAVYEDMVSVRGQDAPISVYLPHQETARPPGGPVSVTQLLHPPARKALAAFAAARKLAAAGAHDQAAAQLEKAVGISPDYAEAWVSLAVQHIHLGRYQQALTELARAGGISTPTAPVLGDMAVAQFALGRPDDALRSARLSLQLDPSYPPAHYLLGSLLARDRRTLPEAVGHLEEAARTMPAARANLERARRDLAPAVTNP
jgi:tetratricopeptide (TPR) repeat protein